MLARREPGWLRTCPAGSKLAPVGQHSCDQQGDVLSETAGTPRTRVALSTGSVYPDSTPDAFETAARLGYDGVEVMVYTDPVSLNVDVLRRLSDYHQIPV